MLVTEEKFIRIGELDLQEGLVDITDPCYDDDIWCRINGFEVQPGVYTGFAHSLEGDSGGYHDYRIAAVAIVHNDLINSLTPDKLFDPKYDRFWEEVGEIGVDAGLAGFFRSPKRNYPDAEWYAFCDHLDECNKEKGERVYCFDNGIFTDSGYGDGCYIVEKWVAYGKVAALRIVFLLKEEEDDD